MALTLHRFPWSTNVDRVALALAHKGLEVESVLVDPEDRAPVRELSGQDLVPVLVDDGEVIADSTRILEHLEARYPDPPLYPDDPARRSGVRVFVEWFDEVWKGPPNLLADERLGLLELDDARRARQGERLRAWLDLLDAMLTGREHLFFQFGAADCVAWPFLRYAGAELDPADTDPFHRVLVEEQPLEPARHANLIAWIARVGERPMA